VAVITEEPETQPARVAVQAAWRGWTACLRLAVRRRRHPGSGGPSVTTVVRGLLALSAALVLPPAGSAAPITGDPGAGRGAPSGVTISCAMEPNGTTTCAVQRGRASVCPERVPGQNLERSYLSYDYQLVEGGCTLPAEYWRTHSRNGDAPFDDVWDRLGEGGEAQFFNAAESYERILAGGAADGTYYRLARAYIAAELNSINGARFPDEVAQAFEEAAVLFLAAEPERMESDTAPRFTALAAVLEQYNAGATGPGTCPPLAEPLSSADVGTVLEGVESRDAGTVISVDQRYGRGGGVMTLEPQSEADQFLLSDEPFTVAGVRKAKFSTVLADCVDVAAGQQTTVVRGGLPSPPRLTTAAFFDQERMMRLIVAVSEAAEAGELAPEAGPTAPTATAAPAFPAAGMAIGGAGGFPSPALPSVGGGGAAGADSIVVPDVIGSTVSEARSAIEGAGLSVGTVTISQQRALLDGIIGVAWAQEDLIVIDQNPDPATLVSAVDPPQVDLEAEAPPDAIPEPASLLLFATGLALIVIVMARRRTG
jgi:PASTA domain/PEP-CTERM motif